MSVLTPSTIDIDRLSIRDLRVESASKAVVVSHAATASCSNLQTAFSAFLVSSHSDEIASLRKHDAIFSFFAASLFASSTACAYLVSCAVYFR